MVTAVCRDWGFRLNLKMVLYLKNQSLTETKLPKFGIDTKLRNVTKKIKLHIDEISTKINNYEKIHSIIATVGLIVFLQ